MTKLSFKPRARLLLQLGDQLIRSESIALLEIIKNSYDADASSVRITMKDIDSEKNGQIIIEDNGAGMDADIIENVWLQPGSDYKKKIIDAMKKPDPSKRLPMGEKGIGRLGAHKLGNHIELISKKKNKKEVSIKIDWADFERDDLLENIDVTLTQHGTPKHFKENPGTRIIITKLKHAWSRAEVRELYRSVISLNSPFNRLDNFRVHFSLDNQDWLEGLIRFEDIKSAALYHADAVIKGNEIKKLTYKFQPWDTMSELKDRVEIQKDIRMIKEIRNSETRKKEQVDIDLSNFYIGEVRFKILIFDRSAKILSLGLTDKKGLKDYLDTNGGVRVFRNGIRVYDYGETGNDWLQLDLMRVNQPGKTISNNLIIGAVDIDRISSKDLIEKTNREGFVENPAYFEFVDAIRFTLDKILTQRNVDKEAVREAYSPASTNEPVTGHLKDLQEKIEKKIKDPDLKHDLLKSIRNIEKDYEVITDIYTRSSSAGLSLGIVIHEIIHMVEELAAAISKKPVDEHVKGLVKMLQRTVGDYAGVIKQNRKSTENLVTLIDQALSNIQFRLKAHEIEILPFYKKRKKLSVDVRCSSGLVVSTLINLIDNSMWWQNYARVKNKKILIDLIEEPKKHISILVADNGPGFTIPATEAVKPFISDKPGGMGLGLHLAHEVMRAQQGELLFPEQGDCEMPHEFQKGAKLLLAFKR